MLFLSLVLYFQAQFHPRNDKMFLVCPMRHAAVLVNVDSSHEIIPIDDEVSSIFHQDI